MSFLSNLFVRKYPYRKVHILENDKRRRKIGQFARQTQNKKGMVNMKRKLSFALSLCLCASALFSTAGADVVNSTDTDSTTSETQTVSTFPDVPASASYAEAVKVLSEAGIIQGDANGKFNPEQTVTRAQATAFLCRMLGIEETAKVKKSTKFSDVPQSYWASGYVAAIADQGVISGFTDGTFKPNNPVTYAQMIKLLVCAWGYEDEALQKGGYPSGYVTIAEQYGITTGVTIVNSQNCPRKNVAQLCCNTLFLAPNGFEIGE